MLRNLTADAVVAEAGFQVCGGPRLTVKHGHPPWPVLLSGSSRGFGCVADCRAAIGSTRPMPATSM